MAITNLSSLDSNFFVNDITVGCAGKIVFDETTGTDDAAAQGAALLCRADYAAIGDGDDPSFAGTWTTTTAGPNSWRVTLDGISRDTTGTDIATNMTYRQLIELKDAGAPVKAAFGTGKPGDDRRQGMALITGVKRESDPKAKPAIETFTVTLLGVGPLTWVENPTV